MSNKFKINRKFFFIVPFIIFFLVTGIVMFLWNCILPKALGIGEINFWQAMGILILSKILFGGMNCSNKGPNKFQKFEIFKRMKKMTPEQREIFKQKIKDKYRNQDFC